MDQAFFRKVKSEYGDIKNYPNIWESVLNKQFYYHGKMQVFVLKLPMEMSLK